MIHSRPFPLLAAMLMLGTANAQQPFAPLGKTSEVLTLSKGQYPEFFANDTLRRVGGFWYNTVTGKAYRFRFNGMEKDDEINDSMGLSYSFEFRFHDPRMGRFLSLDPLSNSYPWNSPYSFGENCVIRYTELEGKEIYDKMKEMATAWNAALKTVGVNNTLEQAQMGAGLFVIGTVEGAYRMANPDPLARLQMATALKQKYDEATTTPTGRAMMSMNATGWLGYKFLLERDVQGVASGNVMEGVEGGLGLALWFTPLLEVKASAAGRVTTIARPYQVATAKFDYFFGRVTEGAAHNVTRSAQNLRDLTTLGITSEESLMQVFDQAAQMTGGTVKTSEYGTTVTRTVQVGDRGAIDVSLFYEGGDMGATPKVSTIIPKVSKKQ